MSKILRLVPHMFVHTPLGVAECHFYEPPDDFETNAHFHCFQCESKEAWIWPSPLIRLCESISGLRDGEHSAIALDEAYFETLRPHILRHPSCPLYGRARGEQK